MNKYRLFLILLLAGMLLTTGAATQPAVPSEGLRAEMAEEWGKALAIYKDVLEREPGRADLWLRISDIEAHLGHQQKAIAALEEAARLEPNDADAHYRLSAAYSESNLPEPAFAAVSRSVELEPDNIAYLKAYAALANWTGRSDLAAVAYEQMLQVLPEDDEALLNYARSSSWSGHTDAAAIAYDQYLTEHPGEKEIYIEQAKVESWRGNYAASLGLLERYRETFGESDDYLHDKARVLAWANRPTEAMEILTQLLEKNADDYDLIYTQTIAFHNDDRPSEKLGALEKLAGLQPDSRDTHDIDRFVTTHLRPDVTFAGSVYTDSDDLDRYRGSVVAGCSPKPEIRVEVGIETDHLEADRGSGFETRDGDKNADHTRGWIGIDAIINPRISVDGYIGAADAEGDGRFIFGAGVDYRPFDNLRLRAETDYGFYVVSPRTVDLGIRRSSSHLQVDWEPDLLHVVFVDLGYNDLSDDNESWEAALAPRRRVLRREKINLDIGLRGTWSGFDEQLDNGYYDPDFYQSYMVTGLVYWKISDDDGVSLAVDLGAVKDDEMSGFDFGWGASVEGVFGLYRDVMLRVGGGVFENQGTEGGAFDAYTGHVALTFRF